MGQVCFSVTNPTKMAFEFFADLLVANKKLAKISSRYNKDWVAETGRWSSEVCKEMVVKLGTTNRLFCCRAISPTFGSSSGPADKFAKAEKQAKQYALSLGVETQRIKAMVVILPLSSKTER